MLSLAAQVIRFSLAFWVGGTLVVVMAAPVLFRQIPSRDLAGAAFGEILRRFEAVKHALSLALVIAVFARLEQQREHRDNQGERKRVLDGLEPAQDLAECRAGEVSRWDLPEEDGGGHHNDESPSDPEGQREADDLRGEREHPRSLWRPDTLNAS